MAGETMRGEMGFAPDPDEKMVRLPVEVVDGEVRLLFGGPLPELRGNPMGELVVPLYSIRNKSLQEMLSKEQTWTAAVTGTDLWVEVWVKEIDKLSKRLRNHLVPPNRDARATSSKHRVRVDLVEDLVLSLDPTKRATLRACRCMIPALGVEVDSLNEAYVRISTAYEPYRRGHTGNVFKKVSKEVVSEASALTPGMQTVDYVSLEALRVRFEDQVEEGLFEALYGETGWAEVKAQIFGDSLSW